MKAVVLVALVALGLSSVGCASQRVRTPAYGPQVLPDASWQVVASAPPPVEASEPGAPPNARVVWIDGQWLYQRVSRKWVWEKGAWCEPPAGAAYYAAPVVRRVRITGRPTLRWNEAESRGEEILPSEDEWSWARGTFFVRDARGAVLPMSGSPTCTPAAGLGDSTAK